MPQCSFAGSRSEPNCANQNTFSGSDRIDPSSHRDWAQNKGTFRSVSVPVLHNNRPANFPTENLGCLSIRGNVWNGEVTRNFEYSTPICAVKIEPFKAQWLRYVPAGLRACLVSQSGVVDSTGNVPFIMSPSMTDLSPVSAVASRYSFRARDSDKRDRSKSSRNLCLDIRWR